MRSWNSAVVSSPTTPRVRYQEKLATGAAVTVMYWFLVQVLWPEALRAVKETMYWAPLLPPRV